MDDFTRANQALFDGNRGEVADLLTKAPHSGRTLWLLASAAEDEEERMALLARIHAAGEQPYAQMAGDILKREQYFAEEIARVPGWQTFFKRHKTRIIRGAVTLPFVIIVLWLGSMLTTPPASTTAITPTARANGGFSAPGTPVPTAVPTVTVTPLPMSQSAVANYMPLGSLRLLNVEYPTLRQVSAGSNAVDAPPGSAFVAVQYEFTCGTVQAFCDAPPQAFLGLELVDSSLGMIPNEGLTLQGSPRAGRIASGSSVSQWVVFAIPQNQSPRRLLIGLNTDEDEEIDATFALDLPR